MNHEDQNELSTAPKPVWGEMTLEERKVLKQKERELEVRTESVDRVIQTLVSAEAVEYRRRKDIASAIVVSSRPLFVQIKELTQEVRDWRMSENKLIWRLAIGALLVVGYFFPGALLVLLAGFAIWAEREYRMYQSGRELRELTAKREQLLYDWTAIGLPDNYFWRVRDIEQDGPNAYDSVTWGNWWLDVEEMLIEAASGKGTRPYLRE